MSLFIDSTLEFEKVSSEIALPEDPNAWPDEVLQELFKQVPYIADFEPHVSMDKVDAERGYAFGHIEVMNKTEIQRGASPEGMEAAGIRQAKIPIVIKDRKLLPFDVLITEDNQMLPLTEARLRQAIFRPQAFDITARTPGDMSMIGQLYPPYRQNYGFGGGGATMSVGMGKMGSLLSAILPTIHTADYDRLFADLNDPSLQAAFTKNAHATVDALKTLASFTPVSTEKTAAALFRTIQPSVLQVVHDDDGYHIKTANALCWLPHRDLWDRGQVVRAFGEKVALDADMNGSVTVAPNATAQEGPQPEKDQYELIKDFGIYKVKTTDGKELIGYVFPNLLDTDGTPLPIFLFTNGSQAAVQGEIVGIKVGGGASLFEGHPRGKGAFYELLTNGRAQATVPMTIKATLQTAEENEGVFLHGETFDGRQVEVKVQPNITKIIGTGSMLLIPESMGWLPLDTAEEVTLMGNPEEADASIKAASGHLFKHVQLRSGGDCFTVSGFPVEKLAADQRSFLSIDDTLFLLGGLGVNLDYAIQKMAQATAISAPVDVVVRTVIEDPGSLVEQSLKTASAMLEKNPLFSLSRPFLLKEAAVIPDPMAVDTVLSLGFINPENVTTFVSYLPTLDEAQKKMCELLLASRLGLRDIPISALERAIRSAEEIIAGLKVMALQKN